MAKSILLVEDSPTEMRVMSDLLHSLGHTVMTATDGEQALTMLELVTPDLVVLDIILPAVNGYMVLRKMRQRPAWKDIPVLVVSSKNLESDIFWGKKQGANSYLCKPFAREDFLLQVNRLC